MDSTESRMQKAQVEAEDESRQAGWMFVGALALLIGGVAMFFASVDNSGQFAGAMLAVIGLALVAAAIWMRAQRTP